MPEERETCQLDESVDTGRGNDSGHADSRSNGYQLREKGDKNLADQNRGRQRCGDLTGT